MTSISSPLRGSGGEDLVWTTRQRSAGAAALAHFPYFIAAQQLYAPMTENGTPIGLTTVYRAPRGLEAAGALDVAQRPTPPHRTAVPDTRVARCG
ncbi:transcriptional repressor [Streptomyces sp. ALI-76-A]|uniref:transcriptional repressor n=1 Tax=Streptomyces sp. ALI-76-A TaxID=3025736 RepID=UPI00256F3BB4|nr:transcriptional repressor [Streptomyces sp. ALI-76-A]MDL5206156.1 transcriptional repressor [Streptomyces sp. ALI-76-A]